MNRGHAVVVARAMRRAVKIRQARAQNGRNVALPASRVAAARTKEIVRNEAKDKGAASAATDPGLKKERSGNDDRSVLIGLSGPSVLNNWNSLNLTVSHRGSSDARDLPSLSSLNVPTHLSALSVWTGQNSKKGQLGLNDCSVQSNQTNWSVQTGGSADSARISLSAQSLRQLQFRKLPGWALRPLSPGSHPEFPPVKEGQSSVGAGNNLSSLSA
jgi:hypothetical protein